MSYSISVKPQFAVHTLDGQQIKVITGPPVVEAHGDVAQEVVRVIKNYMDIFGRKPKNLYVGDLELDLILVYPNPMCLMKCFSDTGELETVFMGLKVHRVHDLTHLSVAE